CGQPAPDGIFQPLQRSSKMVVVRDNEVGRIAKGLNGSLIHRHNVMLIAVQHVVQTVAPFLAVAKDAARQLEVIAGVDEKGQVQFAVDFLEVSDEQAFHNEYGGGFQDNVLWDGRRIIEHIFLPGNRMAFLYLLYIAKELLMVDGCREI